MKKTSLITLLFVLFLSCNIFAQNSQTKNLNQEPPKIIKPMFNVGDIIFVLQTLNTVEVRGAEVESFITVKTLIQTAAQTAQTKNLQQTDSMAVEIQVPIAQNLLNLLDRATIAGGNADRYKRFIDAIVESAKKLQK